MSISLLDKVEAVYELKRLLDRVRLSDQQHAQVDKLVQWTMRENKRMATHVFESDLEHTTRMVIRGQCPTFCNWVSHV